VPEETFKFAFNAINEATSAANSSWDQVHNLSGNVPTQFDISKLVPIGESPPIGD